MKNCDICEEPATPAFHCPICGSTVCRDCFDFEKHTCVDCEEMG